MIVALEQSKFLGLVVNGHCRFFAPSKCPFCSGPWLTCHQLDVYKEESKCKQNFLVNIKTVFLCPFSGSWEGLKPTLKRRRETSDSEEPQKRTNKLLEA